jgi:alcohol dehydrogenase
MWYRRRNGRFATCGMATSDDMTGGDCSDAPARAQRDTPGFIHARTWATFIPMSNATIPTKTRAFVVDGTGRGEIQELPIPAIGPDDVLVRIEGVYGCAGGDTIVYSGKHPHSQGRYPLILGHEGIGIVTAIGSTAAARRGLKVGDRVAVEVMLPCDVNAPDACEPCKGGRYELCEANQQHGVSLPLSLEHGLWGMYSEYLMVHPRAITHRIPDHVTMENAVATAFLANAVRWTEIAGQVAAGEHVAVFGPGPQGVGTCAVATYRGATPILIGLERDQPRFDICTGIGVVEPEHIIRADTEDVVERVMSLTGGRGCDLAIECSGADPAVAPWLRVLRKFGRAVICGYHGGRDVATPVDQISTKELTVVGAWGQAGGFPLAIEILDKKVFDFTPVITNRYPFADLNNIIPRLKDPTAITMKALFVPPNE